MPARILKLSALSRGIECELKPALTWVTAVAQVKKILTGSKVGYGCTYTANNDLKIAVIPVGYHEGYCREYGLGQPYVLLRGRRCPLIGRVSMNMCVVDVSHLDSTAEVKAGEEVILIGKQTGEQGYESVTVEQLAEWGQTIQYQVLTRLHPQIPRIVV